jgi:GNAT superfamily N-acetyltransferase
VNGLRIKEVTDGKTMDDFESTWAKAFTSRLLKPGARRYDIRILGSGQRLWVGYMDGGPIATSGSYVSHGLNLVRAVTVLPDFRGKGVAKALSRCAMAASYYPRFLNSHPPAEGFWKSMGFHVVSTFQYWMWNPLLPTD